MIPSYWAGAAADVHAPGAYDHSTSLNTSAPELARCLDSLEQVRDLPRVIFDMTFSLAQSSFPKLRTQTITANYSLSFFVSLQIHSSPAVGF